MERRHDNRVTVRLPRWVLLVAVFVWVPLLVSSIGSLVDASLSSKRRPRSAADPRAPIAFRDVSERFGIPGESTPTWGSAWFDRDGNGYPDLLINRHKRAPWLLAGGADGFGPIDDGWIHRLPVGRTYYDRHTCSWGEADGDGTPDLMCVSGAQRGEGTGPNQLLLSTSDEPTDVARRMGVLDPLGRGRTVNWFDLDGDGDLDLFLGNEVRSGQPSRLFRNDGGTFVALSSVVAREFATADSAWADVDRDGDPDLLVAGHGALGSRFYRNDSGAFVETELVGITGEVIDSVSWEDFDGDGRVDLLTVTGTEATLWRNNGRTLFEFQRMPLEDGRSAAWLDVENDGDLDLYIVQGVSRGAPLSEADAPDAVYLNEGSGFRKVEAAGIDQRGLGAGDSVATADFDRDGRVDVFVTNGHLQHRGAVSLLRNVSEAGNWAGLRLLGPPANPLGLGTRIRVLTSQGGYWRYLNDEMSYHAQSEVGYVHLGLGVADRAQVKIRWPDGTTDILSVQAGEVRDVRRAD
ncbi:MAG: CRTAC1 family protein [Actinomycetota bacterium]